MVATGTIAGLASPSQVLRSTAVGPTAPAAEPSSLQPPRTADRVSRTDVRPQVTAARLAQAAADRRAKALAEERAERAARQRKLERQQEKREARIRRLGYEPGTSEPREIARQIMKNKFDWGAAEFRCFDKLIKSESQWQVDATNPSSGAYGIPQSLPGSKMASVADDWRTNPATQIIWGLGYVEDRYGSPCSAWGFKQGHNWY